MTSALITRTERELEQISHNLDTATQKMNHINRETNNKIYLLVKKIIIIFGLAIACAILAPYAGLKLGFTVKKLLNISSMIFSITSIALGIICTQKIKHKEFYELSYEIKRLWKEYKRKKNLYHSLRNSLRS